MESQIEINGQTYVSSREAAKEVGYTQDYVGQLARENEIEARKVGGHWYIDLNSLRAHKSQAEEYVPEPPQPSERPVSNDAFVMFDGQEFVASKKAAQITSYTQDYIAQLAREGSVRSERVGNRWFLAKQDLLAHKKENDAKLAAVQADSVGLQRQNDTDEPARKKGDALMEYYDEQGDLLPDIRAKNRISDDGISDYDAADTDIEGQNAAREEYSAREETGADERTEIPIHVEHTQHREPERDPRMPRSSAPVGRSLETIRERRTAREPSERSAEHRGQAHQSKAHRAGKPPKRSKNNASLAFFVYFVIALLLLGGAAGGGWLYMSAQNGAPMFTTTDATQTAAGENEARTQQSLQQRWQTLLDSTPGLDAISGLFSKRIEYTR